MNTKYAILMAVLALDGGGCGNVIPNAPDSGTGGSSIQGLAGEPGTGGKIITATGAGGEATGGSMVSGTGGEGSVVGTGGTTATGGSLGTGGSSVCVNPGNLACADCTQNGQETDVDCGGGVCGVCANGKHCSVNSDCQSNFCGLGVCAVASCTDGIKDQDEAGTDCGGTHCGPCADGSACVTGIDCASSSSCIYGKCVANPTCTGSCSLQIQTECQPSPNTQQIGITMDILNNSASAVQLSRVTLRYWFTLATPSVSPTLNVDYAPAFPTSAMTYMFVPAAVSGGNEYLEMGFVAAAGSLAPKKDTGPVEVRAHGAISFDTTQTSDFSFQSCTTAGSSDAMFEPTSNIAVYLDGILVWGQEPGSVTQ